ncbi:MAG: IS1595 family transposase [Ferruginibacter sp.]
MQFKNFHEASKYFSNEDVCRDELAKLRWKDGIVVCPKCGTAGAYTYANCIWYKCKSVTCKSRFSVTVGTFCENTKLPLSKWFMGIWLISAHKKGISSCQLSRDLGIGRKAAWFMLHRIREMLRTGLTKKMEGISEADEMYVGGSISNKHISVRKKYAESGNNWQENKSLVLGLIQREGEAMAVVVEGDAYSQIVTTIKDNVKPNSHVMTDTHAYYSPLSADFTHSTVNHSANEFIRGNAYTNTIEGMFSHFKRSIYGIYHQISKKHTQRYLDEFIMRWNSRKISDTERFKLAFNTMERRLTYNMLIAEKEVPEVVIIERAPSPRHDYLRKAILQLSGDEVVGTYPSLKAAKRATGIPDTNISMVLKGKRKSAGGFKWVYA